MKNELANQSSVYLRQHALNPVAWQPWNEQTLELVTTAQRPVFVSIGYSTCHWCHVMERESFENAAIAELLNKHFVSIKIDREEFPAVDARFMQALLAMNGRGGWPLNVFLTPELKPFYGGTYFTPHIFTQVLGQIGSLWKDQPQSILQQAEKIEQYLEPSSGSRLTIAASIEENALLDTHQVLRSALHNLGHAELQRLDPTWGGFGVAPKFPRAHTLSALMQLKRLEPADIGLKSLDYAIEHTLKCMAYGGLRDHLEGGFHRYSTDERWLVPHFEKMLYDQAFLMTAYSEAWSLYRHEFYRDIVAEMSEFLETHMRLDNGLWASAWDADSEGEEGRFYVFEYNELENAFSDESLSLRKKFYALHGVSESGNWEEKNVLALSPDTP